MWLSEQCLELLLSCYSMSFPPLHCKMEPGRVSCIQCHTWGKLSMFSTSPAAFVTLLSFRIYLRHLEDLSRQVVALF